MGKLFYDSDFLRNKAKFKQEIQIQNASDQNVLSFIKSYPDLQSCVLIV